MKEVVGVSSVKPVGEIGEGVTRVGEGEGDEETTNKSKKKKKKRKKESDSEVCVNLSIVSLTSFCPNLQGEAIQEKPKKKKHKKKSDTE